MNDALPRISVITPSFNQARYLALTLRSVLDQRYPNLEYWVMDGGSRDGTTDLLRQHDARLAGWVSEPDRGQAHAFNKGLARATGELIGWVNSDDVYLNRNLFAAAAYFRAHPEVDIVFTDYLYIDAADRVLKRRREIPFDYPTYLWSGDCYHANCAGFFRRRVFDRIGPLDESLHYSMDYEFYLRAARAGLRFGHRHAYWAAYRLHDASKSVSQLDKMQAEGRAMLARCRPAGVAPARTALLTRWYKTRRLLTKLAAGSYLPARLPATVQEWMATP